MPCKPGSVLYVVDLGDNAIYVGSTSMTPTARYAKHKAGGRTSVRSVKDRGRGLLQHLIGSAKNEQELMRNLRAKGYTVEGSPTDFCGPTR